MVKLIEKYDKDISLPSRYWEPGVEDMDYWNEKDNSERISHLRDICSEVIEYFKGSVRNFRCDLSHDNVKKGKYIYDDLKITFVARIPQDQVGLFESSAYVDLEVALASTEYNDDLYVHIDYSPGEYYYRKTVVDYPIEIVAKHITDKWTSAHDFLYN